jgi:hypothetical protein
LIGTEVERARRGIFERLFKVRRSLPKRIRAQKYVVRDKLKTEGFSDHEIESGSSSRTPIIAARRFVASERNPEYDTVAKYHREYKH